MLLTELDRNVDSGTPWFVSGVSASPEGEYLDAYGGAIGPDSPYSVALPVGRCLLK